MSLLRSLALAGLSVAVFGASLSAFEAKKAETPKVEEGKPAPDVNLPAVQIEKALPDKKDAKTLNLKDFHGKKNVVLFFYPKALTGGWTVECCGFRDRAEQFAQANTVLIGISVDQLATQQKFADKEMLPYPLLADAEKKVTKTFGILGSNGYAMRRTFVIDKQGVVRKIFTTVKPAGHADEVLAYVKENLK